MRVPLFNLTRTADAASDTYATCLYYEPAISRWCHKDCVLYHICFASMAQFHHILSLRRVGQGTCVALL